MTMDCCRTYHSWKVTHERISSDITLTLGLAVGMMNPDDVRPILKNFHGKNIPEQWAQWENAMNEQHRLQWEQERQSTSKRNLRTLLSGAPQEEGPPPTQLDAMRKQMREAFAAEHEQMRQQQDEMMKREMEEQKAKMKEMKMTVWDLMTQVSSVSLIFCFIYALHLFVERDDGER